jgi:4'-phosphopantetheinyl transferase
MSIPPTTSVSRTSLRSACELWFVDYVDVESASLIDEYARLLDAAETERRARFRFERDQRSFAVSHALLRVVLSNYADVAPEAWRFVADRYGKPTIAEPKLDWPLHFNLSHTRGAASVGVVTGDDIGVDIETLERTTDGDALAERYFSPTEVADLRSLPDSRRRDAFFEYWTLKEAYIKGRGLGLSLPLDQFSFSWDERAISIAFDPRMNDRPESWRFVKWKPAPSLQAAVAVRSAERRSMQFTVRRTVPLVRVDAPIVLASL